MKRREFVSLAARTGASAAVSGAGLGLLSALSRRDVDRRRPAAEPAVLRPPGALAEDRFVATCVRCTLCSDVCPSDCILFARAHDSAPLGTPFIVSGEAGCTLCLECTYACPTGALRPVDRVDQVAMGEAVVDERLCVSFNRSGICGACHTACPLKNSAITLGPHNTPVVHAKHCVGCGLCEEVCILDGVKAIRIYSGRGRS